MKAFHTIAVPHRDILEGRLTMDVFAADLWEVTQQRGADEYKDAETFFKKTYLTEGLRNLLTVVEKRLQGAGGDPVIQIQTPFGGGKTHALIAMYHKAAEWEAKKVAIVGTALSTQETLWGVLEKRLTGKTGRFTGQVAPGKEAIRALLSNNQPVLILMDEVLEYVTKAAGVRVGDSTLAAQTMAFMQELTEAASTLERTCLAVTLPASIIEHYDEGAERLYQQLQKVAGRIERIYTPVQENEITKIIRRRLFMSIDEQNVRRIVAEFMKYAEKEEIFPAGSQPSEYRDRFLDSYPFMPEVVDVLYHRWGSFPTFQRTRGVLRLLSLVIHSLRTSSRPYISLADFDLANQEIRQELLKHIGSEFNSVLAADIIDVTAGASKVDLSLGKSYQGLRLGTRSAAATFLYSFSGGQEHGATLGEVKRSATTTDNPASVVAEAVEQLKGKLFYLQSVGEKYFFRNQPNLNRILLTNMENIREEKVVQMELELLRKSILGSRLRCYVWEEDPSNIPDSEELKLVILKRENKMAMNNMLKNKGQTPRTYRNTLFFLSPSELERNAFNNTIKRKIAYEYIERDPSLNLSEEQKKDVRKELKTAEGDVRESIRKLYRIVSIPSREGTKEIDLGIPTYGELVALDGEIFEKLRSEGEILARIAPLVIKEKFLSSNSYASTRQIYQSALRTPGETRLTDRSVLEQGIVEGVRSGLFGLGELQNDKPLCHYFRESPTVAFSGSEVLIQETICQDQKQREEAVSGKGTGTMPLEPTPASGIKEAPAKWGEDTSVVQGKGKVRLKFRVPKGKVAQIMGVMNLLQSKFDSLEIELLAADGEISEQDYEDKIKESFRQLGIEVDES
ncbi:MAG: DUF499 domain-containing protein [Dehalococcoidales bacterium]|nr:DUF499 domain-containing protein [Dehalococcoidales bacterium]